MRSGRRRAGRVGAGPRGDAGADGGRRTADSGRRTADSGQRTADGGRRTAGGVRCSGVPVWERASLPDGEFAISRTRTHA